MTRTTPPRPVDVEALFPEVVPYRRNAVRLHPRAGRPGVGDSSVGGPVLWPASEPWPECVDDYHRFGLAPELWDRYPLVPVVQLFKRDVPELPFPQGTDLLQVLWCPRNHDDGAPCPQLFWRDSATVGDTVTGPPVVADAEEDYVPALCVLHPERVVEYAQWDLPDDDRRQLEERFALLEDEAGWSYQYHLSVATGIKACDYPGWTQDPDWPGCRQCGEPMDHLLTIDSGEFNGQSWRTWLPVEDAPETGSVFDLPYEQILRIQQAPGLTLGDGGGVYLFVCTRCPAMPHTHRFDCS